MARIYPILSALLLAACQLPGAGGDSARSGAMLYARHCAQCHGTGLRGDGPLASELPVRPTDLTRLSAGNGGVFPTEDVITVIHGYPGRHQLGLMPEFVRDLPPEQTVWTSPDGTSHEVPAAMLALARHIALWQR
ncbi:MAG: cytochrome c [Rhodobacteraceae bacterium]|nr:MAG: cytochrome c [Paracoccaceae bacterium]